MAVLVRLNVVGKGDESATSEGTSSGEEWSCNAASECSFTCASLCGDVAAEVDAVSTGCSSEVL